MNPYQTGQQLGELVFGAPESDRGARNPGLLGLLTGSSGQPGAIYYDTLTRGAKGAQAMEDASKARAQALIADLQLKSRQGLSDAVAGVYTDPAQAALAASVLGSNGTVDVRDLGALANPNYVPAQAAAAQSAISGDTSAMNRFMSLANSKPIEFSKVEGNTVIDPNALPQQQVQGSAPATPDLGDMALGNLPAETQAYVPKVLGGLGDAVPFDASGQPTPALLDSLRQVESGGNDAAVSPAGAQGPYQFMPATAASVGVTNPFDPDQARAGAAKYLAQLYQQFGGDPQKAIAAYNAGPGRVAGAMGGQGAGVPVGVPVAGIRAAGAGATGSGKTDGTYRTLTADELKAAGLPTDAVVQAAPNGKLDIVQKGTAAFQGGEATLPGDPTKNGAEYFQTLDPTLQAAVKGLLDGTKPWPTGTVLKNPLWSQAVLAAQQVDPGFNASTYQQRAKARDKFTSGKQGDMFRQLRTIAMHADQYTRDVHDLDNGNFTPWNAVRNAVGSATGAQAPGNVQTDALALSEEVSKFLTGGVPAVTTINEWKDALGTNASRDQQISRMTRVIGIVSGQLASLVQQYRSAMGPVSQPLAVVNPAAAEAFHSIVDAADRFGIELPPHVKAMQDEFSISNPTANPATVPSSPTPTVPAASGPIAVNPQTGERVQLVDGKWVTIGGGNG